MPETRESQIDPITGIGVEVDEGFHVRDAATANWVVRKILEARAYAARVTAWAELEHRRAERDEQFLLRRFGVELEEWARQQIATQHDKRQSVSLPAGSIGFRVEPTKLCVTDEPALLAWCRQHLPSAIRTVESPMKTPLNDHLKTTGECPDGTTLIGGGRKFYVTVKNHKLNEGAPHEMCKTEESDAVPQQGPRATDDSVRFGQAHDSL